MLATWRERALNAEDALKAAHAEILAQRTRIGELLGQVRDLEAEWTQETVQRITTENTALKRRVRRLTADNRTLADPGSTPSAAGLGTAATSSPGAYLGPGRAQATRSRSNSCRQSGPDKLFMTQADHTDR
jgi:hypothetical protein